MIITRFLMPQEYLNYGDWLKRLDPDTRTTYFGIPYTDEQIDRLMDRIAADPIDNHFLVAEYRGEWIGTVHLAEFGEREIEFGFIVAPEHRGHGLADRLMSEATVWARNRGYESLYMHCLSWNTPIRRLCVKHGMTLETEAGETETKLPLPPADLSTLTTEVITRNRQAYRMFLQTVNPFLKEAYV